MCVLWPSTLKASKPSASSADFQPCFASELVARSFHGSAEPVTSASETHGRAELIGRHFLRRKTTRDLGRPIRPTTPRGRLSTFQQWGTTSRWWSPRAATDADSRHPARSYRAGDSHRLLLCRRVALSSDLFLHAVKFVGRELRLNRDDTRQNLVGTHVVLLRSAMTNGESPRHPHAMPTSRLE